MRKALYICIWELSKLVSDWKKSIVVFMLPPVLMLGALILFPTLVNYLATGSLDRTTIANVNAPDDYIDFIEENYSNSSYKFIYMNQDEFENIKISDDKNKNTIFVVFSEDNQINVTYCDTTVLENKAIQFMDDALATYNEETGSENIFNTDTFNPVKKVLDNRAIANSHGSTIIPQIIVLLIYYTVYSLSQDIFHGDKERGFLTKLKMTPVSLKSIVYGKMSSVVLTSLIAAVISFFILFLASWINTSNDPMSLIPFGLWLMPGEILWFLFVSLLSSVVMSSIVTLTVFSLERTEDVTINLQLPLVIILIEVFMLMVREGSAAGIEYLIPIHNSIVIIRDIIHAKVTFPRMTAFIISSLITVLIANKSLWKKEFLNGKQQ